MKKYAIAIVVAVLLSLCVMLVSLTTRPDVVYLSQDSIDNATSILSTAYLSAVNADLDENYAFEVQGGDAQLYISAINDEVGALIVDFEEPLAKGTMYQLYYSANGAGLNEGNSILSVTDSDTDVLVICLPEITYYDTLRLDIDQDYQLEDLAVIDSEEDMYSSGNYLTGIFEGHAPFPTGQLLTCLVILAAEALLIAWKLEEIRRWAEKLRGEIRENRRGILRGAALCAGFAVAGCLVWFVMHKTGHANSSSKYSAFYFAVFGLAVGAMLAVLRQLGEHPERGFLIIALCFGMLFAVMEAPTAGQCWDDETHYSRVVGLSYGDTAYITKPERMVANMAVIGAAGIDGKQSSSQYLNSIKFRWTGNNGNRQTPAPYNCIPAYLPAAGAIWLTRLLGFPFTITVMAGRAANLLCYALVIFFALKQLKYGRLAVAGVCLLPTVLFMAGNYSYDAFCIGMIVLGVCIWLGVYQRPERRMTAGRTIVMLIVFVLGMLPKQVYFPVMLLALFLPRDRFASRGATLRYRLAILAAVAVLLVTIAMPFFLYSGASYSDARGGDNVDAAAQVSYILRHPVFYFNVLMRYLFEQYFSYANIMNHGGGIVRAFAYIGLQGVIFPEAWACALVALIVAGWAGSSDLRDSDDRLPVWLKALAVLVVFGTVCMAGTSMYCVFTPVSAGSINGFQERYMLPAVLPLFAIVRPTFLRNAVTQRRYNAWVLMLEMLVMMIGMLPFAQFYLG